MNHPMDREMWRRRDERLAVEAMLCEALNAARDRHEVAKREMNHRVELARSLGMETPDGCHALLKATKQYNVTLREYRQALSRFCDFILDGKSPPPGDSSQDPAGF